MDDTHPSAPAHVLDPCPFGCVPCHDPVSLKALHLWTTRGG